MALLEISDLSVKTGKTSILSNLSLSIGKGEIHVLMGPNGSGKSTLANVIMGHPGYEVTSGSLVFDNENIQEHSPEERARKGLFLSFQHPREIAGVSFDRFLFATYKEQKIARGEKPLSILKFQQHLKELLQILKLSEEVLKRSVNVGFSGGEKKKLELLQLHVLEPKLAILDEIDSGLDVDALKQMGHSLKEYMDDSRSLLVVTHYQGILEYINPDKVHVLINGKLVTSGKEEILEQINQKGFDAFTS